MPLRIFWTSKACHRISWTYGARARPRRCSMLRRRCARRCRLSLKLDRASGGVTMGAVRIGSDWSRRGGLGMDRCAELAGRVRCGLACSRSPGQARAVTSGRVLGRRLHLGQARDELYVRARAPPSLGLSARAHVPDGAQPGTSILELAAVADWSAVARSLDLRVLQEGRVAQHWLPRGPDQLGSAVRDQLGAGHSHLVRSLSAPPAVPGGESTRGLVLGADGCCRLTSSPPAGRLRGRVGRSPPPGLDSSASPAGDSIRGDQLDVDVLLVALGCELEHLQQACLLTLGRLRATGFSGGPSGVVCIWAESKATSRSWL
mmetsp:Transcript_20106/g.64937  ORF Transcript_20106/g.64937 Transcript_20106/m.64937 type:complete len:318 (-) Transcript_20106:137-1090(-)